MGYLEFSKQSPSRKGGVNERATNKELNLQIREEFTFGSANLQGKDKQLFRKYTCPRLIDQTIPYKRYWLNAVRAARNASTIQTHTDTASQRSILEFVNLDEDNIIATLRTVTVNEVFTRDEDILDTQNTSAIEEIVPPATQRSILDFFSTSGVTPSYR